MLLQEVGKELAVIQGQRALLELLRRQPKPAQERCSQALAQALQSDVATQALCANNLLVSQAQQKGMIPKVCQVIFCLQM